MQKELGPWASEIKPEVRKTQGGHSTCLMHMDMAQDRELLPGAETPDTDLSPTEEGRS